MADVQYSKPLEAETDGVVAVMDFKSAQQLLSDPLSCVSVDNSKRHIMLPPRHLDNVVIGVREILEAELFKYCERYHMTDLSIANVDHGIISLNRSRPNWIAGPGLKSGSAGKSESCGPENGVSRWRRPNSDIYSQNYHFGLGYTMMWYINFLAWRQRIISLVCFANLPSIRGPRWCRYLTEKCLPDSHLPFVYIVILSVCPFWTSGDTNPSTKTSKILFWIVMPTFGKSCRRPSLAGPQNPKLSWILKQIFQDGGQWTCTLGRKHTRKSASFWLQKHVQYFLIKLAKYLMLKACWLWFVILKNMWN